MILYKIYVLVFIKCTDTNFSFNLTLLCQRNGICDMNIGSLYILLDAFTTIPVVCSI